MLNTYDEMLAQALINQVAIAIQAQSFEKTTDNAEMTLRYFEGLAALAESISALKEAGQSTLSLDQVNKILAKVQLMNQENA